MFLTYLTLPPYSGTLPTYMYLYIYLPNLTYYTYMFPST